jgi:hypothetical protein
MNRLSVVFASQVTLILENQKWSHHGDTMDVALPGFSYRLGVDPEKWQTKDLLLFSSLQLHL